MAKLTKNEKTLLFAIKNSEFHDGQNPLNNAVWTDCVCECFNNTKTASGTMSSLVKKGLAESQGKGRDAVCWITQAGLDALDAAENCDGTNPEKCILLEHYHGLDKLEGK